MTDIKNYVLSVILAAIISGILTNLFSKKCTQGTLIQLLAGIFITVTVISPWKKIHFSEITDFMDTIETVSAGAVADGSKVYDHAVRTGIIDQTQAYILEKAALLGADLEVSVILNDDTPPTPVSVKLSGNVSPYAKKQLAQIMVNDLGIPEVSQIWN